MNAAVRLSTIKRRRDFLVAAQGKKFITDRVIVQMTIRQADHPAGKEARIGFTVTRKIGNAVVRNRIKRRLREAARKIFAMGQPGCDYVIIPRAKAVECDFSDLVRDMEFAFSRIHTKKGVEKTK